MSNVFEDYVKDRAFSLSLSKGMVRVLLCLYDNLEDDRNLNMTPYQALQRRGLIMWKHDDETGKTHGPYITTAGDYVVKLLKIANYGLQKENKKL